MFLIYKFVCVCVCIYVHTCAYDVHRHMCVYLHVYLHVYVLFTSPPLFILMCKLTKYCILKQTITIHITYQLNMSAESEQTKSRPKGPYPKTNYQRIGTRISGRIG